MIVCHLPEAIWGPLDVSEWCSRAVNAVTGMDISLEDARRTAERQWNIMRAFMVREGYRRKDDKLPRRFMEEPIPRGPSKGMVIDWANFNKMLEEYYDFWGWEKFSGIPTPERLRSLDMGEIAKDMEDYLSREKAQVAK
jgi:aldehyde:ferredoxin oxidoreductase